MTDWLSAPDILTSYADVGFYFYISDSHINSQYLNMFIFTGIVFSLAHRVFVFLPRSIKKAVPFKDGDSDKYSVSPVSTTGEE